MDLGFGINFNEDKSIEEFGFGINFNEDKSIWDFGSKNNPRSKIQNLKSKKGF